MRTDGGHGRDAGQDRRASGPPAVLTVIMNTSSPADLHLLRRMIVMTARLDLPDEANLPVLSEMHHFPLPELLAIRSRP